MTNPEIEKVAKEYLKSNSDTGFFDTFKAGYLKGVEKAIEVCKEKIESSKRDMEESKIYGTNSVGYGMDLGAHDSACEIANELEQIEASDE